MAGLDGDFVTKTRFNEVNEENKTLKQSVSDRDKQLNDLKKSSGDNAELKAQIEELQKKNTEQAKAHAAEMAQLKLDNAVDTALTAAGARTTRPLKPCLICLRSSWVRMASCRAGMNRFLLFRSRILTCSTPNSPQTRVSGFQSRQAG